MFTCKLQVTILVAGLVNNNMPVRKFLWTKAQPGDLVFWGPSSGVTHHVGIYLGNGLYIHAPQPGDKVRITSIADYAPDFAVRVNIAGLPIANGSLANSSILDGLGDFNFSKNQTTDQFLKKLPIKCSRNRTKKTASTASVMMAQAIPRKWLRQQLIIQ